METLLVLSGLKTSTEMLPVQPEIRFAVDDDGGVEVHKQTEPQKSDVLEEDDKISLCVTSVLEALKDSALVLTFYEKLASFIDFSTLNTSDVSPNMLLTDEDVNLKQFEEMRKIALSCCLLTHLSENEKVVGDLFNNLTEAVPFVNTLISVGCQRCEEEHRNLQVTLVMNVSMLVSYYVGERTLVKKMSSKDWKALKSLLPSLEAVAQNMSDEGVLLCVDQLKNMILTHGVVNTPLSTGTSPAAKKTDTEDAVPKINLESSSAPFKDVNVDDFKKTLNTKPGDKKQIKDASASNDVKVKTESHVKTRVGTDDKATSKIAKPQTTKENFREQTSYAEAMEDLFSPLLPIRGHALLALGKLVEKNDQETLAHKEKLLSVFQHNLKEEDSYLYLMAVQGLAVLCDAFPDQVRHSNRVVNSNGKLMLIASVRHLLNCSNSTI